MDRGAWQATVHGVTRVGHDLATKPPPPSHPFQSLAAPSGLPVCLIQAHTVGECLLLPEAVGILGGASSRSCFLNLWGVSAVRPALQRKLREETDKQTDSCPVFI